MADENEDLTQRDEDLTEEESGKKQPATYEDMANRYLSRSRKSLDIRNRPAEEQASYFLSAAQVYAILELAQAMRESSSR